MKPSFLLPRLSMVAVATCLGIVTLPTAARASVLITLIESGGNVNVIGGGTINLTGLTFSFNSSGSGSLVANEGVVFVGDFSDIVVYDGATGPTNFGSGGFSFPTSTTGSMFGIRGNNSRIAVPLGYVNTTLSGSATWTSASFVSLGLTPGTYTWNWGSGATAESYSGRSKLRGMPRKASALEPKPQKKWAS